MKHREIILTDSDVKRFWSHVEKGGSDECWPWKLACYKDGYGTFGVWDGERTNAFIASRVVYTIIFGGIPGQKVVRHTCDNPPCCNPRHLLLGTQKQNVQDCVQRCRLNKPRGEQSTNSKITVEQVVELRKRRLSGIRIKDLTAGMSISWQQGYRVLRGQSWAHVPGAVAA